MNITEARDLLDAYIQAGLGEQTLLIQGCLAADMIVPRELNGENYLSVERDI